MSGNDVTGDATGETFLEDETKYQWFTAAMKIQWGDGMQARVLIRVLGLVLSLGSANAWSAQSDAQQVVKVAADEVINILEKEGDAVRKDPKRLYEVIKANILPYFDFDKMSYFVLGKYWKQASVAQQARFQEGFKHLLINTYATALAEYNTDQEIVYQQAQIAGNGKAAIVPTEIHQKDSAPIPVVYRLYKSEDSWRIFDVIISGVSLVKNYRASFAGQIRRDGLDKLIDSLVEHNKPESSARNLAP